MHFQIRSINVISAKMYCFFPVFSLNFIIPSAFFYRNCCFCSVSLQVNLKEKKKRICHSNEKIFSFVRTSLVSICYFELYDDDLQFNKEFESKREREIKRESLCDWMAEQGQKVMVNNQTFLSATRDRK